MEGVFYWENYAEVCNDLNARTYFEKYPTVKVQWYDVEAFSTKASGIAMFETTSLQDYYFVIDAIRDSEFCTVPYFEFVEIIPAIKDGYVEYEKSL